MNDETAREGRIATSTFTASEDSKATGERPPRLIRVYAPPRRPSRPRVPRFHVEIPFEGRVTAVIRGANDEADAARLRAWAALDPDMSEIVRLVRRLRDRLGAA